jgi:glutathione S-transferase
VSDLTLAIGNRNYSSWSLRAWVMLRHLGLKFSERQFLLDTPTFHSEVAAFSPTRRVPVLRDGDVVVWDSLAICEYACELAGRGWPRESAARAVARSVAAEMHSGFAALRAQWPMNVRARGRKVSMTVALRADLERIDAIWSDCRARFGGGGNWLFGAQYTAADAMFSAVVMRLRTYGAPLGATSLRYMEAALDDPILTEWIRAAQAEPWIIEADEAGQ